MRLQPSTASVWQETFDFLTATNLPTSGVQDHKFEETKSMEARCVASLGFAYHDCEGAELMMLMMMLWLGLCLIGVTSNDCNDISLSFLSGNANMGSIRRVSTASQKRRWRMRTQRLKYFISEALSSNWESRLLMLRFGAT